MSLNSEDIKKIAHLARLNISEELEQTTKDGLNKILKLVDQINEVDTNNIEPMSHSYETYQLMAEDEVLEPNIRDEIQSIAPDAEEGFYLVPKVVE